VQASDSGDTEASGLIEPEVKARPMLLHRPCQSPVSMPQDQSEWQIEWQTALVRARLALASAVCARVSAGQLLHLGLHICRAIQGKEKIYGSIP
jgi:hypothetical protein